MYIIATLPFIPLRHEPSHKAEQVSQLLFGEQAMVLETKDEWYRVKCLFDGYTGWIEQKVVKQIGNEFTNAEVVKGFSRLVNIDGGGVWLSTGCVLASQLIVRGQSTVVTINPDLNTESVVDIALQFLGTPYLWGGRSFMGVDCSGLVQVVYKAIGIKLPRDASQQEEIGDAVDLELSQAGDLAFFANKAGYVTHVGIVMADGKILHASGAVRIDSLDKKGIFNEEIKEHTHRLVCVKRIQCA